MKRVICLLLITAIAMTSLMLSSCSFLDGEQKEIAMVTDGGSVANSSLNQAVWSGVVDFATANNKSCEAYHPKTQSLDDRISAIMDAIINGARIVVCSGRALEEAVFEVEDLFPDVRFILVDGEPRGVVDTVPTHFMPNETTAVETEAVETTQSTTPQIKISKNVYCITFKEEQAGYLAGYVAVRDGYTKLGFLSYDDSVSDMLYGTGFLQGIEDAASEMGILDRIDVKFRYNASGSSAEVIQNVAENWYIGGTEIIFASGMNCEPVIAAAEAKNGRVICTDSDHSSVSNIVVTSSMKFVYKPIMNALESLYANNLRWDDEHAGQTDELGVAEDGVGLPTELAAWRFGNFTFDAYRMLVADIIGGEIDISNSYEIFEEHLINIEFIS